MVTTHERIDMVPISASFVGIRMMEDPSMLSITAIVSCRQVIFGFSTEATEVGISAKAIFLRGLKGGAEL